MLDYTFLEKATREKFIPGLRNQLYDEMPLMKDFVGNGVKEASGRKLLTDVVLKRANAHGTFQGYDPISTQEVNPLVAATLDYANYYASISISLEEEAKNSGGNNQKLVDMLEVKFKNAKSTLKEDIYKALFLDGTLDAGKVTLVGFKAVCSASNTYAGINRGTAGNEGWQSNVDATAYTNAQLVNPTDRTKYLPSLMRKQWRAASHDSSPNRIVCTDDLWELYQYIAETHNARFGMEVANLMFGDQKLGNVQIIPDKYCTANHMFFLNTADFEVHIFPGMNFDAANVSGTGTWTRSSGQLAASQQIVWMGQVICLVPRQQALLSSLAAS